MTFTFRLDIDI